MLCTHSMEKSGKELCTKREPKSQKWNDSTGRPQTFPWLWTICSIPWYIHQYTYSSWDAPPCKEPRDPSLQRRSIGVTLAQDTLVEAKYNGKEPKEIPWNRTQNFLHLLNDSWGKQERKTTKRSSWSTSRKYLFSNCFSPHPHLLASKCRISYRNSKNDQLFPVEMPLPTDFKKNIILILT